MSSVDRRTFLKVFASIPFVVWLERDARAVTALTQARVRHNVSSTAGQAMLKIYADGVAKMKALPESDPRSWTFQWYTHAVPLNANRRSTKVDELNRIFPAPGPQRELAKNVWDTCQAHFSTVNQPYFLPWHRMYLHSFEAIIRKLTNHPEFTLPYWNYLDLNQRSLPAAFLDMNSPLYVQNRIADVNKGRPIDALIDGALDTAALSECGYNPSSTAVLGFCQALDSSVHGLVHVLVGEERNMGSVPWAARDPIFWLHHCNIDRLWASWNISGRMNPNDANFLDKTFTFADANGQQVIGKVRDVVIMRGKTVVSKLGSTMFYEYSEYEKISRCVPKGKFSGKKVVRVLASDGPVTLASDSVRVQLKTPEALRAAAPEETFAMRIRKLASNARVYLVISNLQAAAPPNALYVLYFALPENDLASPPVEYRVGVINFFDAIVRNEEHDRARADDDKRFFSFDVTSLVRHLQKERRLTSESSVTIIPVALGESMSDAKPVIGSIEVVFQ